MGDTNKQQEFSVDLLRVYYGRLFPYGPMYDWLSYWNGTECGLVSNEQVIDRDFFPKREWSFTIEDDIYIRYQSFRDKNEFIAAIQKRQPHKIDIGAVFSAPPKDHTLIKPEAFKPVQRELVFDIDMTDYDNIRKCCTGANICLKCWPYMTMAIKVVDQSLREDFAFQNILWVYSGRRGVHCWVCDPLARNLSNDDRTAIVDYLTVETGSSENSDKKVKNTFLNNASATGGSAVHPMILRAYATLEPLFEKYIVGEDGQGLLSNKESFMNILKSIPVESVRQDLYEEIEKDKQISSAADNNKKAFLRWKLIKQATSAPSATNSSTTNNGNKKKKYVNHYELEAWRMELVFTHCYPRLDANVSKAQNHLLKSPFCVHPKTGRVCVPIDPRLADDFNPFKVPTLGVLCAELDKHNAENAVSEENQDNVSANKSSTNTTDSSIPDYEKTSLHHALRTFEKCFLGELRTVVKREFREKENKIAAMNVDF